MANGRHARGKHRRPAPASHRRKKTSLPGAPGAPAVVAGAAAMAVATVGGLNVAEAQTTVGAPYQRTSDVALQAIQLDGQLVQLRQAAHERELRASRERARRALAERKRKEVAERKRKEVERRKKELVRLAEMYVLPLDTFRLTASFGASSGLWSSTHTGQDFAAPSGTPVQAVAKGVVTSAEWAGAYGWRVIIRHSDGTETWYCHLSSFVVRSGTVQPGQQIGRVGSTGNTTGPHLHFEVRQHDIPISPLVWLRAHGVRI